MNIPVVKISCFHGVLVHYKFIVLHDLSHDRIKSIESTCYDQFIIMSVHRPSWVMNHEAQSISVARHPCRKIHSVVLCPQGRGVHEPLTEMCCNLKCMHIIQNKSNWQENVKYFCTCTRISCLLIFS